MADGASCHTTPSGFPRVFYLRYHGYRWYFPLMALARYRNLRLGNTHRVAFRILARNNIATDVREPAAHGQFHTGRWPTHPGMKPALTVTAGLVARLRSGHPAGYGWPGQCPATDV